MGNNNNKKQETSFTCRDGKGTVTGSSCSNRAGKMCSKGGHPCKRVK